VFTQADFKIFSRPRVVLLKQTRTKMCQFIASLSVILLQLKLTKAKLEVVKFDFQCRKEK